MNRPIVPLKQQPDRRSLVGRIPALGKGILLAGSALLYTLVGSAAEQPLPSKAGMEYGKEVPFLNVKSPRKVAVPQFVSAAAVSYRVEDSDIPTSIEYIESDQVPRGNSRVANQGKKGTQRRVIRTIRVGGELAEEKMLHEFILETPKKRVIIRNTRPPEEGLQYDQSTKLSRKAEVPDRGKLEYKKMLAVEATAYTYTGNKTATGIDPREGIIAVDPRVIPLGTRVYIEGYGYAVAADTGGAIKGKIIDVFFPNLQKCLRWGRRPVNLYIL